MKLTVIIFALALCTVSAFDISSYITQRKRYMSRTMKESPNARITFGKSAATNQFPYQVGLSLFDGESYSWCGGSLISNEWVLTAAHCIINATSAIALLGSIVRLDPAVMVKVNSTNMIAHANYDDNKVINDIALIKIAAVNYTDAIQPIALPGIDSFHDSFIGETVTASGWGYTSDMATSPSPVLLYADFKIISNEKCDQYFDKTQINKGQICTATPNRIATCSGDSGGPLVLTSSKVLIGISSFGALEGCEVDIPDVFTRVTYYLNWIQSNTGLMLGANSSKLLET